ncbi:uncharacterized protein SPAPADRAFT_53032 [Spathaspora passalidarum NRRL Y-27907]|uniref:Importin N-terminal domain-containing protein n=1 Tax=Spathaspora passalidarum (strain NRRL Y-27907 / 11-Y1) TaxID=619300 RepID=G3AVP5_SPAPN|nr:uncharacterized protein SPAPADRAFT_53032 [Spathaspora passalidarum NRRL Y-27907]EGW30210.1 hypothetical protein SPAPADRAFT_53032 [Spathaspora passalidarum NRRL Y-27907]
MSDLLITLILNQTNSDNNIRTAAELEFNQFLKQDPTNAAYIILESALNQDYPIDLRQSCLLHLKRLVPYYWSMGFQSFIGPPIAQDVKVKIRQSLLELATSSPESKLRNGSAYAIVQIASADYPDEWPELLNVLYSATMNFSNENSLIGGLQVLTDLFDDLITEEQFWEGGIAGQVTSHINDILTGDLSSEVKTQAIKLYSNVVDILSSPEAFSKPPRKQFVINHVASSIQIFAQLLEKSYNNSTGNTSTVYLSELNLRTSIYRILNLLLGQFHKKITQETKANLLSLTIQDFNYVAQLFANFVVVENTANVPEIKTTSDLTSISSILSNLLEELLVTVSNCQLDISVGEVAPHEQFFKDLVTVSSLTQSTIEEYQADINVYASDLTGLSTVSRVRETVNDVLSELNESDSSQVYKRVIEGLAGGQGDWRLIEAQLYILESLFINDDVSFDQLELSPPDLLNLFARYISYDKPLVTARSFILLPKFFEKFSNIPKETRRKAFSDMIVFTIGLLDKDFEACDFIKIACLVSITYYKHVIDFNHDLAPQGKDIQTAIFTIVHSLIEESEEDGLPSLLEAITEAISIDPQQATTIQIGNDINVIDLIFKITFKDPANVQLIVDTSDCLTSLLKNISIDNYLQTCEKSLPVIFEIMNQEIKRNNVEVEYTPELYLALELLSIIIESVPESQQELPSSIFYYAFPILRRILTLSQDNQILQSGGEVFNNIIQKASKLFLEYQDPETKQSGIDCMMEIVYKFLSPELSDSAANNCGSIVYSLIDQFQSYLTSDLLTQILKATVLRLSYAKESITIENLIMVFCKLIINSPQEMVDFLSNNISLTIDGVAKSGLEIILPIWFESYEVTRGYEHIKQNSLALGKIFSLGDARVENLVVNGEIIPYEGDLIITRSMAKAMPDKYTQIPACLKILKLLVGELEFQCQQPNAEDYLPEREELGEADNDDDDDEEGWEDMEDIGVPNFEKLKSYVDSDAEGDRDSDESLKHLLIQFLRECTVKDLGHFRKYYEELNDQEKKTITENLVF